MGELWVWQNGQLVTRNPEPGTVVVRLPTEEEWERAARGANGREYPWGDEFETWRANTEESDTKEGYGIRTTAVCTYPQGVSPDGVWDAAGNVWEWTVSAEGDRRVLRGGSWLDFQRYARCAFRYWYLPVNFYLIVGFRLVVSLALPSSDS